MKYIISLAALLIYVPVCFAPIIHTTQVTDILKHTDGTQPSKTLVLFDMDEVLGIPVTNTDFRLVESATVPLIKRLQSKKYNCCVLTARGAWSHTITHGQLKKHDIDFGSSTPFKNLTFKKDRIEHKDGIAYVANGSKGAFLTHLLTEHKELDIEKIIFIDDKYYNLVDVEQALLGMNFTNFTGLHYTRAVASDMPTRMKSKKQVKSEPQKTKTSIVN